MDYIDRRVVPRRTVDMPATIALHDDANTEIECMVRDYSDRGARLELPGVVALPDTIWLHVPFEDLQTRASVRWRADSQIGVMFIPDEDADDEDEAST